MPDGYTMQGLPDNIKMTTPDGGIIFKRNSSFNDGMLNIQMTVEFKSPTYAIDMYPDLKEFYKKMSAMLNEKFVYVKK